MWPEKELTSNEAYDVMSLVNNVTVFLSIG
jgi:hypothetical protein